MKIKSIEIVKNLFLLTTLIAFKSISAQEKKPLENINVTEILKGKSVCRDQKIDIRVWRPSLRIPPITGPQGHYPIPVKGDRVRVYIKMEGEKKYSALLPNGFSIIN